MRPATADINSVSSASQPDEEVSALSDSSAEAKVQPVLSSNNRRIAPNFDQPEVAASPAPVPIQGGDDEVIQVSHVRKIKVNLTEPPAPKVHKVHKPPTFAATRPEQGPPKPPLPIFSGPNHPEIDSKTENKKKMKKKMPVEDAEEDVSDSEPMDVIEKSPYENNLDAEKGVAMFTRMKSILKERKEGDDYRTVNEEATKIFGPNAWCLVKANGARTFLEYGQEL